MLAFLTTTEFVLWSLFTTIAGLFLQLEATIQATVSRDISRHSHSTRENFITAFKNGTRAYRYFAIFAFLALFIGGFAYLFRLEIVNNLPDWQWQWLLFISVYLGNYLTGQNNAVLIATDELARFGLNNTMSRIANLVVAATLMQLGFGLWALVGSFAISVIIGCTINAIAAARVRKAFIEQLPIGGVVAQMPGVKLSDIGAYAVFLGLSYGAYRLILLASAAVMPIKVADLAELALGLQLFAIIVMLVLTPVTFRIAPLIRAISADARRDTALEFARMHLLVNIGMLACSSTLIAFVALFRDYISASTPLPSLLLVLALSAAFLVEVNLQTIAGVFLGRKDFWFVRCYAISIVVALTVAFLGVVIFDFTVVEMVAVMTAIQFLVALPLFYRRLQSWPGVSFSVYREALRTAVHEFRFRPSAGLNVSDSG